MYKIVYQHKLEIPSRKVKNVEKKDDDLSSVSLFQNIVPVRNDQKNKSKI